MWLAEYRSAHYAWLQSQAQNPTLAAEAAALLSRLLEREPDYAPDVARLAMQACWVARALADVDALAPFVKLTRVAAIHRAVSTQPMAVVLLSYAQVLLRDDRRIDGLQAIAEVDRLVGEPLDASSSFEWWIRATRGLLLGKLWEAGLEARRAHEAFEETACFVEPLIRDRAARDRLATQWISQLDEVGEGSSMIENIAHKEFERLYTESAIGSAMNLTDDVAAADCDRAASRAIDVLTDNGPSPGFPPLAMAAILTWLEPAEADAAATRVVSALERWKAAQLSRVVPAEFTDPEVHAMIERALADANERIRLESLVWPVVVGIGRASARRRVGETDGARRLLLEAAREALETRLGIAQLAAFGALAGLDQSIGNPDPGSSDAFLQTLAAVASADPTLLADRAVRAALEEPIAALALAEMRRLAADIRPAERRRAGAIIDLIRSPTAPDEGRLEAVKSERSTASADDVIERIERSLAERPGALVLVIQSLPSGAAFLALRAGRRPSFGIAGAAYAKALERFDSAAQSSLLSLMAGVEIAGSADSARDAGTSAFQALPADIGEALRDCSALLLVADVRGPRSIQPFELFHDGEEYLGLKIPLARFTSLRHLADALEQGPGRAGRSRAMVTAVPYGRLSLPAAAVELDRIQALFAAQGYDAPRIEPARLTPQFYRDRIAQVDVLHIAAHGESEADQEWLVLPDGPEGEPQRLTVDDFLDHAGQRLPFIYLSTCNLARTRYLGGGIGRGLAYTLAELGAPAVISNTGPVLDEESLALVARFYTRTQQECVGDALRHARKESGTSPTTWGRAVMFGNPWHRLPLAQPPTGNLSTSKSTQ